MRAGKTLQMIRIENGCLEQFLLAAEGMGWKENKVRDREISVAAIALHEISRLAIVLGMDKVEIAKRMLAPVTISLDRVTIPNTSIGMWERSGKFGEVKKWAECIIERDYKNNFQIYDDYHDSILFYTDTIDDVRRQVEEDIREGRFTPTKLVDTSHLGVEWEISEMKKHGRQLKAARLKKSLASQWVASSKLTLNASWIQCRESAKVSVKLEDVVAIAQGWDMNPFDLVAKLLDDDAPDDNELKILRRRYC